MRARYARFVEMHRKFDDSFKIMAVEVSVVRGSVAAVPRSWMSTPVCSVNGVGTHVLTGARHFSTIPR